MRAIPQAWGCLFLALILGSAPVRAARAAKGNAPSSDLTLTPSYTPVSLDPRDAFERVRYTSGLGVRLLREETGAAVINRISYRPNHGHWITGAEVEFSLFSPGSTLGGLVGGWYEARVSGAPRLSLTLGILAGGALTSKLVGIPTAIPIAMVEAAIVQEIDELVSMQGQFRPGIFGGYFSFCMNLSAAFRFQ